KAIHISAHTGVETFVLELSALKSEFDAAMDAFEMLLKDPNFTIKTLDKVKTTTIGALLQKENDFDYVASKELKALLFEGTVLAHPSSGTVESVKDIDIDDVEEFYKNHVVQANAIGIFGGDITQEDAEKAYKRILDLLPVGKSEAVRTVNVRKKPLEKVIKKDTQQAYVYFGSPFHISVDSPDYYKARVAMYVLGTGGFGTRLMEEIRVKRGLAYSAYSRMAISKSHSYLSGQLQTKVESGDEALALVKSEFDRFVKKGVTQKELSAAKEFLLGSEPLRTETLSQRLSRTFMAFYKGLDLDNDTKELKRIEKLTLVDLNHFIKSHPEILELSVVTVTK
ncbi:MAG: insulinase family protein, partial [Thiovulaceae bacterium]|nr:insulinase family protein [Sulfurimonadaceae bacterium]